MKNLPDSVRIVEVGPRDGLQNENASVPVGDKIQLVNRLSKAGFSKIETGSFVAEKWVPQMASSDQVFAGIDRRPGTRYTCLVPNLTGFTAAARARADEVAIFGSASEAFSRKNINCSISESLERFQPVVAAATNQGIPVRGYVSCAIHCPYKGDVDPAAALELSNALLEMGCYEISLSDTTGRGTPASMERLLDIVLGSIPASNLALHCHDTYGQGLANIHTGLQHGISVFDSSVAGLGGCPYAEGASGNVATEDLLYMLHGMGIETGIDLDETIAAGRFITGVLACPTRSKVAQANGDTA